MLYLHSGCDSEMDLIYMMAAFCAQQAALQRADDKDAEAGTRRAAMASGVFS